MSDEKVKTDRSREEIVEQEEEAKSGQRVSGEPDQNLAAIGAGGISGAAAGAVIGTAVGGPVGGAIGAAAGALAGGAAGDAVAAKFDPKIEEAYWAENFKKRPYYKAGEKYEDYLPAYRFGWESAIHDEYADRDFEALESELQKAWQRQQTPYRNWNDARPIIRESFERIRARSRKSSK